MQLKAAEQVVGKDRALRPGALSAVVIGGNDHEGEFTFELSEGLLLRPRPAVKYQSIGGVSASLVVTAEYSK